jgi:signal transduction histidine kinase/CheY-like chemotaxis protein/HPt (histidine-containing phosphotransfer) domain-containing protein
MHSSLLSSPFRPDSDILTNIQKFPHGNEGMSDITTRNTGTTAALWAGGVALALLAGAGLYAGAAHTVAVDAQARFDHMARTGRQQLAGAVHSYADVVRGLAGLFQAHGGTVTRLQFHRYVETLGVAEHYPALESVNYAAWVEEGARDAFVAGVRADRSLDPAGYPDFAIRPNVHRPSYTVLTYLEPWAPEKAGVDMAGGAPAPAQALARARDSGRMAASGKPFVVERPVRHLGLALRMPVYRTDGAVPSDVEGRRAAYAGSVGIGFSIPALVRGALPGGDAPVALQLYAAADSRVADPLRVNDADDLLYDGAGPVLAAGGDVFDTVLPVRFDDNLWKARFVARRADLVGDFGRVFPWLAGAGGFGATLLTYALFLNLARSRRTAVDQRRLLDLVLDNVDAYVYLKDRDRRYRYVNAKMAAACGLAAGAIVGRRDRDVMPPAQADALWALDRPVLELGEKRAEQNAFAGGDGVVRQMWSVKVPVRFAGGDDVDAVLCVSTDVTELHALQARADAASRAKSAFLSNMSHEIRTPMNSIIGMAHLALKRVQDPKQRDYLDKIHHAGQHLLGIINDILDFSRIEAGKVELEARDFTLDALMRNVAGQLGAQAAARGLELAFDVAPDLQCPLRGDPLRLEQVLLNFVGNAIKFSERGTVAVRARAERTPGAGLLVRFEVEDHGIGIAADDLAQLFTPFHQADPSTTRVHGGTGLGLVISKQLAELMGGTVGATSVPGQGSTFWFTARLRPVAAAQPPAAPAPAPAEARGLEGLTILLVEDNAFNQLVARELLEDAGAAVVVADDGAQALARLEDATVDCVLMDVQMPVMDGIEATRRIRADARLAGLKVIAMTANAGIEDQARCLAAGMDEFLTKPAAPGTLVATIARAVRGRDTLIDLGVLSDALDGRPERMRMFAFLFLDAARDGMQEIDQALAAQEPARAAAVAHRLKSAARTVGALGFGDVCADLERQAEPAALGQARTLAARLHGLLTRLERHILAELGARHQDRPT